MKIWLIYKVAMAFWINIHGCQPYPRNSHLSTKSDISSKMIAIVSHCTKGYKKALNHNNTKYRRRETIEE